MTNFPEYLYEKVKLTIDSWDEPDIYAISFFVYSNEAFTYKQYQNISQFDVSYNTEQDCEGAPQLSEQRWNYAFWRQDVTMIINPDDEEDEGVKQLFKWYDENGIVNIGFEDDDSMYDNDGRYIGKGPIGYYELLTIVSNVARRLQQEGFISNKFGRSIPIIVHDLEYPWYVEEATKNANPNNQADVFLESLSKDFPE